MTLAFDLDPNRADLRHWYELGRKSSGYTSLDDGMIIAWIAADLNNHLLDAAIYWLGVLHLRRLGPLEDA